MRHPESRYTHSISFSFWCTLILLFRIINLIYIINLLRATKKACTSRGGSKKTFIRSRDDVDSSSSFTHISQSSRENLNVDYERMQENYGVDDDLDALLDDIQSPDNLDTPPPTPGNASQTQNIWGESRGNTSRPPLPHSIFFLAFAIVGSIDS